MHFDIDLDERLTAAISPTYDVGNYTGSIIAALQLLSDILRNKSGLDSDGQSLAGGALGGTNPIVKLNTLRTESERDEQKGVEALLRGLYTGVRNPRSHELRKDNAVDANAIIAFINWILRLIDGSKSPFDPEDIISRVLDEHFVTNDVYAMLLAKEVPARIRLDVLMRLVDKVTYTRALNARAFITAMTAMMGEGEQLQLWDYVSSKMTTGTSDGELATIVKVCGPTWESCSEMARLRSENRLLKSVAEGRTDADNRTTKGGVGLRALDINYQVLSLKEDLRLLLKSKLTSFEVEERRYFYRHFMELFAKLEPLPEPTTKHIITHRLKSQDSDVFFALAFIDGLPDGDPWVVAFQEAREAFTFKDDDDIPF